MPTRETPTSRRLAGASVIVRASEPNTSELSPITDNVKPVAMPPGWQRQINLYLPRALGEPSFAFVLGSNLAWRGGGLQDAIAALGLKPEQLARLYKPLRRGRRAGLARCRQGLRWLFLNDVPASWGPVLLSPRRGADALSVGAQLARAGGGDLALTVAAATVVDPKTSILEREQLFSAVASGWRPVSPRKCSRPQRGNSHAPR
jgi:hypothetical protein